MDILPLTVLLPFITACVIIESTPGPNMAYLAIVSLNNGRKAGYAVTAGVALGLLTIGIACALGVGTLIANSEVMYQILRFAGVGYLFWLAWDGWRAEGEADPTKTDGMTGQAKYFRRGLITNLLNPKAALFYVAILPSFISPVGPVLAQVMLLTVVFVIIATAIHALIVTLASTLRPYIESPESRQVVRRVLSVLLACVAVWFAITTGKGV